MCGKRDSCSRSNQPARILSHGLPMNTDLVDILLSEPES